MDDYKKMKNMMDKIEKRWNISFSSNKSFSDFLNRFYQEAFGLFVDFYKNMGGEISEELNENSSMLLASDTIDTITERELSETGSLKEFIVLLSAFLIPVFAFMDKVEQELGRQFIIEALTEIEHISPENVLIETSEGFAYSFTLSKEYPEEIYPYLISILMNYYLLCIFNRVMVFSNGLGFRVFLDNNRLQILPEGAKILDDQVVNQDLIWLKEHPLSLEYYEKSLQGYLLKEPGFERNTLDNLRYSLEQLMKDILGNKKSLENNNKEILSWLKVYRFK